MAIVFWELPQEAKKRTYFGSMLKESAWMVQSLPVTFWQSRSVKMTLNDFMMRLRFGGFIHGIRLIPGAFLGVVHLKPSFREGDGVGQVGQLA